MYNRRKFLQAATALGLAGLIPSRLKAINSESFSNNQAPESGHVFLSTWSLGIPANLKSAETIENGGSILDAVEQGVMIPEADPKVQSVGYGGLPDRDGFVTLDSCIMGPDGNAGSVCFLQDIMHPVSVARKVMENSPHVMLSGKGALKFALENGFERKNLLTEASEKAWKELIRKNNYEPEPNWEEKYNKYHDTIGLVGVDKNGDMAGACTTSGLYGKIHGRVGDSPIIGAGLFVDNEVGAAAATGMGELVMKTLGSFLVVEFMRNGLSPQQACEKAVKRILKKLPADKKFQVGFIALAKNGSVGAYSIHPGFSYSLYKNGKNELIKADSYYEVSKQEKGSKISR